MMPASTLTADSAEEATETAALPDGAAVPDGYTEQYTVQDEDNGFTVTVYAPEGVVPEGVTLSAALLSESDDAYAAAEEALAENADEDSDYGFAALDIHFEDADGNEVEPEGDVYVVIDAQGLLPEDADADTVTVQHHGESDGAVTVETVADAAEETDGVVAVTDDTTLQAAFTVDSFSTFTISWSSGSGGGSTTYFRVNVHYVDEDGDEIQGTQTTDISITGNVSNSGSTYTFSDYAGTISGYSYSGAHYDSYNGSTVTRMTFSQTTDRGQTTRTLTFSNGNTQVTGLTYSSTGPGNGTQTADIYLVYKENAETVDTVDTISKGVSISLYDYSSSINFGRTNTSDNYFLFSGDGLGTFSNNSNYWWNYWTQSGGGVTQGIVSSTLNEAGYPTLSDGLRLATSTSTYSDSLASLFGGGGNSAVTAYEGLNYLFQYDEDTGYYSFDSSENFATINPTGSSNDGDYDANFTVYDRATMGSSSGASGSPYFMPFNDIDTNETDSDANYHFGMKITMDFLMPADGKINGESMTFSFAGDDDVWVYIDGVLILDMGGVHDSNSGEINFGTGKVTVGSVYSINGTTNSNRSQELYIGDLLHAAYEDDDEYISENLYQGEDGHWYLKDYTTHSFAFFYLERGAVDSNCAVSFNLYTLQQNSLTVGKELSTSTNTTTEMDEWLGDLEYTFRVLEADADPDTIDTDDLFIKPGTTFDIYDSNGRDTGENGTVASDGTFTLKAGQYAVFTNISENAGSYYVQELVESEYSKQFGSVTVSVSPSEGNSSLIDDNGATIDEQKFSGIISGTMDASDGSGVVVFTNQVDTTNLSMLTITKEASDGSEFDKDDKFTIYVEIDGEPLNGTFSEVEFENGCGTFSVGTTVSIPVLTGAEFTIYEVNGSDYNVVCSAEQIFANEEGNPSGSYKLTVNSDENSSVSGEVGDIANTALPEGTTVTDATNATMAVTLTNSSYDFNTSLPIDKTLVGWTDGDDYTFSFEVEEVDQDGSSLDSSTDGVSAVGADITISDSGASTGTVYFNFKSDVENGTYYFKVYEDTDGTTGVTYDTSYYIVTVTVTSEDGIKSASVTDVTKYTADGEQDTSFSWDSTNGATSLAFTNSLTTSITIKKTDSDGSTPLKGASFQLYYTVNDTNYYYYKSSDGEVGWTETQANATPLTSDDGGLIPIDGLRMDGTYYLVETKAPDGYQLLTDAISISWDNSGNLVAYKGTTALSSNYINQETNTITVTNTTGQELPSTGGSGTTYLTISGLLLVAIAVGGGFATKRLRKSGTTFDR